MAHRTMKGLHTYRMAPKQENPEEVRFAKAWDQHNERGQTLAYLLDPNNGVGMGPIDPADRDVVVAATVMQWLGSPVGQNFLADLGYEKREPSRKKK